MLARTTFRLRSSPGTFRLRSSPGTFRLRSSLGAAARDDHGLCGASHYVYHLEPRLHLHHAP